MAIDDEYQSFFEGLADSQRPRVAKALRKEADDLVEAQKAALRSQLQPPEDSGDLEDSIRVTEGEDDLDLAVEAGGDELQGFDHAEAFEHGTTRQPARPFFFPPYRERREQIQERIMKAIDK